MSRDYRTDGPSRAEIDAMPGSVVVEFGTDWCGWCLAAQPLIDEAFADYPGVARIRIEDAKGRPEGRSFGIKLWPTLVFLSDGTEVARVTRPRDAGTISQALGALAAIDQSDG